MSEKMGFETISDVGPHGAAVAHYGGAAACPRADWPG